MLKNYSCNRRAIGTKSKSMEFKLRKRNRPERPALELITEFYDFLQGELPDNVVMGKGHKPKLSKKRPCQSFGTYRRFCPFYLKI